MKPKCKAWNSDTNQKSNSSNNKSRPCQVDHNYPTHNGQKSLGRKKNSINYHFNNKIENTTNSLNKDSINSNKN